MAYKIFWTKEAVFNLEEILQYLEKRWTVKEANNFRQKLKKILDVIQQTPTIFPISRFNSDLRYAVVFKQTVLFYQINRERIEIIYLFVSWKNPDKISST